MKPGRLEQICVMVGLVLLTASAGWFGWRWLNLKFPVVPAQETSGKPFELERPDAGRKPSIHVWPAPKALARGSDWVYDVFSPPEIFYDPLTQQFTVTPPSADAFLPKAPKLSEQLKLLSVEGELFPLQLLGFVGEREQYWGTFENKVTYETLLLQQGDEIETLNLKVKKLEVDRVETQIPESMTVREARVWATVQDNRTGEETVLKQGVPTMTNVLVARIQLVEDPERIYEVLAGDLIEIEQERYRIDEIRLAPAEVDVTKEMPAPIDSESHTLILRPSNTP